MSEIRDTSQKVVYPPLKAFLRFLFFCLTIRFIVKSYLTIISSFIKILVNKYDLTRVLINL